MNVGKPGLLWIFHEIFGTLLSCSNPAESRAMKNITITLEPEVVRWVRIKAAEQETSISRYVGELLKEMMEANPQYEHARRQYLALPPKPLGNPDEPLPQRETLYDRAVLR